MSTKTQYAERDHEKQGEHYMTHVSAMTGEALHGKSAIAAELAHRDIEMERQPIETAPKDGSAFVGLKNRLSFRTRYSNYYEKFPHEPGGPTFMGIWEAEDSSGFFPWSPTQWIPLS